VDQLIRGGADRTAFRAGSCALYILPRCNYRECHLSRRYTRGYIRISAGYNAALREIYSPRPIARNRIALPDSRSSGRGKKKKKRKKEEREGGAGGVGDIFRESVPRKYPPAPPIRFFQTGLTALPPLSSCLTVKMPKINSAAGMSLGSPKVETREIVCEIASRNYRALLTTPRSTATIKARERRITAPPRSWKL